MRKMIIVLLFLCAGSSAYGLWPYNSNTYDTIDLTLTAGYYFSDSDQIDPATQIGGPVSTYNLKNSNIYSFGFGVQKNIYEWGRGKYFYGADILYFLKTDDLSGAILTDIKSINYSNDTVSVNPSVDSKGYTHTLSLSPFFGYKLFQLSFGRNQNSVRNLSLYASVSPQLWFNFSTLAVNSYKIETDDVYKFIGDPQILGRDGEFQTEDSRWAENPVEVGLSMMFSFELRWRLRERNPGKNSIFPYIISLKYNFIAGQSAYSNNWTNYYSGINLKFHFLVDLLYFPNRDENGFIIL